MGLVKINFDRARLVIGDMVGLLVVEIPLAAVKQDTSFGGPETEEVTSCYFAIQHAWELGYKVIVEGDCSNIISELKHNYIPDTSAGFIFLNLISRFPMYRK